MKTSYWFNSDRHRVKTLTQVLLSIPIFISLIVIYGCSQTTSGGVGHNVRRAPAKSAHHPIASQGDESMRGLLVYTEAKRHHDFSPITHDLKTLEQALRDEISARGGIVENEPSLQALRLTITVSRYETHRLPSMPSNSRYRTFLDFSSRMDHAEGRSLPDDGIRSIAGSAAKPADSHTEALRRFVETVLLQPRPKSFLRQHQISKEGLIAIRLQQLAREIYERADKIIKTRRPSSPIRIALAPLNDDTNNLIGAQLLPTLMQNFSAPDYRFFTRTQLAGILEEQSLQMSDIVDQRTTVAAGGMLQGVDYMITGVVVERENELTVQIEIIAVDSGEVLASSAATSRN